MIMILTFLSTSDIIYTMIEKLQKHYENAINAKAKGRRMFQRAADCESKLKTELELYVRDNHSKLPSIRFPLSQTKVAEAVGTTLRYIYLVEKGDVHIISSATLLKILQWYANTEFRNNGTS